MPTPTINHLKNKANQNKTENQVTWIKMVLITNDLSVSRRKTQWTRLGLKSLVLYKVQATVRCQKKPTVFLSIDGQRLTKPILNHNTYIQAHVIHILATSFIWIVYCFLSAYICFLLSDINCLCYISNNISVFRTY